RKEVPREELLGKTVIVVANLAPAMLRGVESRGMLLAVKTPGGVRPLPVLGEAGRGLAVPGHGGGAQGRSGLAPARPLSPRSVAPSAGRLGRHRAPARLRQAGAR